MSETEGVSAVTMQINSTEVAGLLAFAPAAFTTGAAAARTRARRGKGALRWGIIAAIHALLVAEVVASTRFVAEDEIRQLLRQANEYSERRGPQADALLLIAAMAIVIAFLVVRKSPTRTSAIASGATVAAVTIFVVEGVSLHRVDAILYAPAGPILLIGWLWLACGWSSAIAAATVRA